MAAATPATSNGKLRGKVGWQRVVRSTSVMGTGRHGSLTRPRLTMQQQLQLQQQRRKEEEEKRKELDTALQTTKTDLEEVTLKYENEKSKKEEMARKLDQLNAELASTYAQLERANRSLEVVRAESRQKALLVAGLQKEVRRLEDRMNVLEYRCMDVEKLEIAVENGKRAFEAKQQQLSSSEHEVRALTRSIEETQKAITEAEAKITVMTAQVDDLKIQVREEVIKNVSLEQKVAAIPSLEEKLQAKESEAAGLRKTVEEKDVLYHHTRQSLREEKDKTQKLSKEVADAMNMKEEYNMALAENITLKKLVQAKDVLLIQKSQILANVRNVVSSGNRGDSVDELLQEALDSKGAFVATYPLGSRMQGVNNLWQITDGDHETQTNDNEAMCLPGSYEVCSDVKVKFRTTTSQRELRLLDDAPEATSSAQRTQHGTPEVSSSASKLTHNALKTGVTELQSDSLEIQRRTSEETHAKPTTSFFKSILRQDSGRPEVNGWRTRSVSPPATAKTCIVRPQLYGGSSFADFRNIQSATTSGGDDVTTVDLKSDSSRPASALSGGRAIVKRVHSFIRVRGLSRRTNKITVLAASSPREATVQRSWSAGCGAARCFVRTSSFLSPELLAPKRDKTIASIVHVGSRVIVDLSKRRDKHRNRQSGIVRYVGTLDKQHDGFCLYAGIRFDKPIGDTDGMYKGKHYFSTCSKHGRFVSITKIVAVLDEGNVYREVDDLLPSAGGSDRKPAACPGRGIESPVVQTQAAKQMEHD